MFILLLQICVVPDHRAAKRELRTAAAKSRTSGVLETPDAEAAHHCISLHPIP
ncbi:hypothetical protein PDJAM_G00107020 [Pangasius djambal]|uniref:Uncharacterized protein n=1 Tax=Pangasius djambal TaxID=1691987 RepID=A0ACC5Y1J2_9TELE|nr:hypothetical protein [Pangasius djambal]